MNDNDLLETNKINLTNRKSIPDELLFKPETSINTKTTTLHISSKHRQKDLNQLNINTNNAQLLCIEEFLFVILSATCNEYINSPTQIIFTQISNRITNHLCIGENDILFNDITKTPIFNVINTFI